MSEATGSEPAGSPLETLLDAERDLDERLAIHHREAEARREDARRAADEWIARQRQLIAERERSRLEEERRQFDQCLAEEIRRKEEELAGALAALDEIGDRLCAQMLAKLLLMK